MGILNVTPDSFSDGGLHLESDRAVEFGTLLHHDGAHMVDVGGESTRPGATRVPGRIEQSRVLPVITRLVEQGVPVSIDTMRSATANAAIEAGATVVNDVSGGVIDPDMFAVVASAEVDIVLNHWRLNPDTDGPSDAGTVSDFNDVLLDVRDDLLRRVDDAIAAGVAPERIILDPGLGFGKTNKQNWLLLSGLEVLVAQGFRVLVGASRKRFVANALAQCRTPANTNKDVATAALSALAVTKGVWGTRVHDIAGTRDAVAVARAWRNAACT
ncbi:dihydropteroate synthase [Rhodococcus sp. 06-621-2]|nr:dihydropteroate synthase [Rhodococcus sp. 06-621-2]OZC59820.1 dihydropteroate synthase [Rhodococcus sp. 06-621-2]